MLFVECANAYGDDTFCTFEANKGQCVNDSAYMMKYCQKACSRCDADAIGIPILHYIINHLYFLDPM